MNWPGTTAVGYSGCIAAPWVAFLQLQIVPNWVSLLNSCGEKEAEL